MWQKIEKWEENILSKKKVPPKKKEEINLGKKIDPKKGHYPKRGTSWPHFLGPKITPFSERN